MSVAFSSDFIVDDIQPHVYRTGIGFEFISNDSKEAIDVSFSTQQQSVYFTISDPSVMPFVLDLLDEDGLQHPVYFTFQTGINGKVKMVLDFVSVKKNIYVGDIPEGKYEIIKEAVELFNQGINQALEGPKSV